MTSDQNPNNSAATAATKPQSQEILHNLVDGEDPMDFIKKNMEKLQPEVQTAPEQVIKDVETKRAQDLSAEENDGIESEVVVAVPDIAAALTARKQEILSDGTDTGEAGEPSEGGEQDPKVEEPTGAEGVSGEEREGTEGEEEETGEGNTSAENFKKLRTVVKEAKATLKTREEELTAATQKLKQYEAGDLFPEAIQERDARIAELERYEQLVSLKTSPQYREKFLRPLEGIKTRLEEIAKDYEIPAEVMNEALGLTNRADLNRFLSSHFDDVGALEVKQLVTQAKELEQGAKEAEKEPENALERILDDAEAAREERRQAELAVMSQTTKDAWIDSLLQIKEEGEVLELIHKDGDTAHNQTFVDPIIKKAASEYGKIVALLSENGLESLPKDLAFALSRMCQLAHASAVALHSRNNAVKYVKELENNVQRSTNYIRPQIGSTNGGGSVSSGSQAQGTQRTTPLEAADKLLNSVLPGNR